MIKLESFLYNQIKDKSDQITIQYIDQFHSLSESSHLINERKGALLGYFCIVNIIKKLNDENKNEESKEEESKKGVIIHIKLLDKLMEYIISSLKDNDPKIVYLAAQCLYNIMLFFKSYALKNFKDFYDALLTLVTVEDQEVKEIADNLDSSLKGIINYYFQGKFPEDFNLLEFFQKIILNINLENPANKCIIVSWISCINQIPEIKLINILYLFLGDLFDMLQIKNIKVNEITNECLEDFYNEIENDFDDIDYNIKIKIFGIVIQKCEKSKLDEKNVKFKSFKWANLFLKKYKFLFIRSNNRKRTLRNKKVNNVGSEASSNAINTSINSNINDSILEKDKEKINESNNSIDADDKKFLFELFARFLKIIFNTLKEVKDLKELKDIKENKQSNNLYAIVEDCNNCLLSIIEKYDMNKNNMRILEDVLMDYLLFENKELIINILKWLEKFFDKFSNEAFKNNFNKFIEKFSSISVFKDEEIFEKGIETLCNIEKCRENSINDIVLNIINKLKEKDNNFAIKRVTQFVKVLCKELNTKYVYLTFADVLSKINKSDFACKIINILNYFLLTSNETQEVRNILKNIQKTTKVEEKKFFEKLFSTWCINPVSCLILCLIAEDFELSHLLLSKLGDVKFKLIQENYLEYSQLVNVLESKSFLSKYIINFCFRYKNIFITT